MNETASSLLTVLAVFDGGAPEPALRAVAGACGFDSAAFQRQRESALRAGLMREIAPGRCEAAEASAAGDDEPTLAAARRAHAEYFAEWATERHASRDDLERELPNLRAGFRAATQPATRDDPAVVAYAVALSDLFIARQNWEDAIAWLLEAAQACQSLADEEMEAAVRAKLGLAHCLRGAWSAGYDAYAAAAPLLDRIGDRATLATVEGNLGLLALALGDTRAESHLKRSATLSAQLKLRGKETGVVEHALVLLVTQGSDAAAALAMARLRS